MVSAPRVYGLEPDTIWPFSHATRGMFQCPTKELILSINCRSVELHVIFSYHRTNVSMPTKELIIPTNLCFLGTRISNPVNIDIGYFQNQILLQMYALSAHMFSAQEHRDWIELLNIMPIIGKYRNNRAKWNKSTNVSV